MSPLSAIQMNALKKKMIKISLQEHNSRLVVLNNQYNHLGQMNVFCMESTIIILDITQEEACSLS